MNAPSEFRGEEPHVEAVRAEGSPRPNPSGSLFGAMLRRTRGKESRLSFSKRLGLSYTFVRSMESGTRYPSDDVLQEIARKLRLSEDELLLAAHCDRSPGLMSALAKRGVFVQESASPEPGERVSGKQGA